MMRIVSWEPDCYIFITPNECGHSFHDFPIVCFISFFLVVQKLLCVFFLEMAAAAAESRDVTPPKTSRFY
jgi:hypothetical protein